MKKTFGLGLIIFLACAAAFAQPAKIEPTPTPVKVYVTNNLPPPKHFATPTPLPRPVATDDRDDANDQEDVSGPNDATARSARVVSPAPSPSSFRTMSFAQIKSRIAEAKRQMISRPIQTASEDPELTTGYVRVAFYDWTSQKIDYVVMAKNVFLSKDGFATQLMSSNGKPVTARTIRANGVNTPVTLTDASGHAHLPLLVQYPVEKGGRLIETAYYMSTHPGIVTPEVVSAGRFYVHNVIEIARDKLKARGIAIQPKVADIAERLATVEHVDHDRFRKEPHQVIYNDIFTLYALNEGQTYRYSVSSAGAGGMVQMIPATYRMIRSRYSNVPLIPDFVEGMRNHVNATQAMLLYMQMTWNDLTSSPTITGALATKIATPEQLMAAGYNSNPARLAGYINRGGENWTNLIPRETQIYLQIYDSLEKFVPMQPRSH
jgi:hypothetical protein